LVGHGLASELGIPVSDAAPSTLTSPYTRQTYRYTPLLALVLAPNEWLHPSFGKYLFAACDIVNGVLIYRMSLLLFPKRRDDSPAERGILPADTDALATFCAMLHLLNPLVFSISTRGSSEAVLGTLILLTLAYALRGRWDAAAVGLGLASHWKLYPIVYGVACLGVINEGMGTWGWRRLFNQRTIRFTILSAGTFTFLGLGCYLV
jgi:phosphatidylinositol glycan class M